MRTPSTRMGLALTIRPQGAVVCLNNRISTSQLVRLEPPKGIEAWQRAANRAGTGRITGPMVRAAVQAVQAPARPESKQSERRREYLGHRRQLQELMSQLLELILRRRPYEELIQKAAALDAQVRFFSPPPRKR